MSRLQGHWYVKLSTDFKVIGMSRLQGHWYEGLDGGGGGGGWYSLFIKKFAHYSSH